MLRLRLLVITLIAMILVVVEFLQSQAQTFLVQINY